MWPLLLGLLSSCKALGAVSSLFRQSGRKQIYLQRAHRILNGLERFRVEHPIAAISQGTGFLVCNHIEVTWQMQGDVLFYAPHPL